MSGVVLTKIYKEPMFDIQEILRYCGCGKDGGESYLCFTVSANRFLRNMVRAIVGTMIEIGRGRMKAEDLPEVLASKNRCRAGQSVPGNALFLTKVEY